MKFTPALIIGLAIGTATTFVAYDAQSDAQSQPLLEAPDSQAKAIFAGGCFWCVEADFDKVEGVTATVSGYIGGTTENPTYYTHSADGHYEAVEVSYDPTIVRYEELVEYFFHHIDPTDAEGQFCDKGPSYRTAVFVNTIDERAIAQKQILDIDKSRQLPGPVVTKVIEAGDFWPAEAKHQDFYKKSYVRYNSYRNGCGRDAALEALWGDKGSS